MRVLGIETSTRVGTLALVDGRQVLGKEIISENLRHAGSFEEALERLFKKALLRKADFDAVAVGLGPGSFTGMRVGLTLAKGFSFVFGRPLWGVGSLEVLAHQVASSTRRLCPVIAGEAREIYGAVFEREGGRWVKIVPEFNLSVEELPHVTGEDVFVFGPGLEKHRDSIERLFGKERVDSGLVFPDAASAALLAQDQAWRVEGSGVELRYVKPLSIKQS